MSSSSSHALYVFSLDFRCCLYKIGQLHWTERHGAAKKRKQGGGESTEMISLSKGCLFQMHRVRTKFCKMHKLKHLISRRNLFLVLASFINSSCGKRMSMSSGLSEHRHPRTAGLLCWKCERGREDKV